MCQVDFTEKRASYGWMAEMAIGILQRLHELTKSQVVES
jgi:hypothetical protein